MKSKKVYIGVTAIIVSLVIVIASIFYIMSNRKDVEISQFEKNIDNGNTKEAMLEQEAEKAENTNEEKEEQKEEAQEEAKEEPKEEKKEETKKKEKKSEPKEVEPKEIVVEDASGTKFTTADSLNVRSGPETSYSKVGSLKFASEVEITGVSGIWYRINYNGREGFVRGDYLSDTKPEPKPEPVATDNSSSDASGTGILDHLIVINSRNNTLRYYASGNLVASYSCATGASGTPTPQGKFSIFEKMVNRPYGKTPNIPGDSPRNALGRRWMQFKSGGYAIHGTNDESSIGKHCSHGCVRMHNDEVIELYSMVPYGTTVIVKNTSASDREIAAGYGIQIN
ncbi:MAG: L,D-transpeptidase family protein [Clostridia bacterium]|nr:L,D-transpeptidase family protein [Clostridia bacterium]